jgi:GNAT superfamily N-acetyltransferase
MESILHDASPAALAAASEANLLALFRSIGSWSRAQFHEDADVLRLYTGIPVALLNSVLGARIDPSCADERIGEVLAAYQATGTPMMWWTGPTTQPADLARRLEARGLTFASESPGMAADLPRLRDDLPPTEGLTIMAAEDRAALEQWLEPFAAGFELPDFASRAVFDIVAEISMASPHIFRNYVGLLDGQPVASCSLLFSAGVAGIYNVATLPAARRRGVGAAITLAAMRVAREHGYRFAVLQATEMGYPVYRRLGFEECCKFTHYIWQGSD